MLPQSLKARLQDHLQHVKRILEKSQKLSYLSPFLRHSPYIPPETMENTASSSATAGFMRTLLEEAYNAMLQPKGFIKKQYIHCWAQTMIST